MDMIAPGGTQTAPDLSHSGLPAASPIIISASRGWGERVRMALADLGETFRHWPLVWTLSLFDIRLRYRGSVLGPFWLTLSTAIMIAAIGFVYAGLFRQNVGQYLPFLAISLILWGFISTVTAEGATCLTQSDSMIRARRMPHSLHAARVVARNLLVLAHNLVVILVVFLVFPTRLSFSLVTLAPAMLLWLVDGFAFALLLGVIGARFRDVPPIVGSIMQIAFYLTPIMWNPAMLAHRGLSLALIQLNPFYGLLEIMRGPLLGLPFEPTAWIIALSYSVALLGLSFLVFVQARPRIPYWV